MQLNQSKLMSMLTKTIVLTSTSHSQVASHRDVQETGVVKGHHADMAMLCLSTPTSTSTWIGKIVLRFAMLDSSHQGSKPRGTN
jgi:hypothetical protein